MTISSSGQPPIGATGARSLLGKATQTALVRAIEPLVAEHGPAGTSGIVALREGTDAFATRYLLAEAAERTLDIQYYIWHNDVAGGLLFDALRRAAARGVRVRLLLDDNNTVGLDAVLASLNAQPGIEIRLFNPCRHRRWRLVDYATDFARLNRRMHNKSFTVDKQATIVGGRNVGDEYFGARHEVMFVDLDVLAIGPVVGDVSNDFERYWNSESARPAGEVLSAIAGSPIVKGHSVADAGPDDAAADAYRHALESSTVVRDLFAGTLGFEWGVTIMLSDDPAKAVGRVDDEQLLFTKLKSLIGTPNSDLRVISAYFVPGVEGSAYLAALATGKVHVAVLTNSLEATDVPVVHAGYAKRRRRLLQAGVELFELKRGAATPSAAKFRAGGRGSRMGSSGSSLHAKTFAVDNERVFVGSFNFDPRSARLNTELGFLIESPALACEIAKAFAERIPPRAYRVTLGERRHLNWLDLQDGETVVQTAEPGATRWRRLMVALLELAPIEWLL
jgi:putative cardiolipin synthase